MIKRILVPLDTSELSRRVLHTALSIADRFESEVWLLRISGEAASLEKGIAEVDLRVIEAETDSLMTEALNKLGEGHAIGPDQIHAEVRSGPLTQIIAETAEEHFIDLIIMGTHGRQGVAEMFTGSTTEQVVAKCPASVMVIKPEGFPYLRD